MAKLYYVTSLQLIMGTCEVEVQEVGGTQGPGHGRGGGLVPKVGLFIAVYLHLLGSWVLG
jgi:hypothetical protein